MLSCCENLHLFDKISPNSKLISTGLIFFSPEQSSTGSVLTSCRSLVEHLNWWSKDRSFDLYSEHLYFDRISPGRYQDKIGKSSVGLGYNAEQSAFVRVSGRLGIRRRNLRFDFSLRSARKQVLSVIVHYTSIDINFSEKDACFKLVFARLGISLIEPERLINWNALKLCFLSCW